MRQAFASMVALLLVFAAQTPASAASAQALVQKPTFGQAQAAVDKVRWRGGWGYGGGWGGYGYGYRGYRPWGGYYGYGYYPPVYGYYYRPYPYWGLYYGYGGWGHRRWHRHW